MRQSLAALLILFASVVSGQINIDVQTLGAVGNNSTVNTAFIQQAIDSVSNNGGGEVIINGGTFISSTIRLKSNVTLRVTSGTTLKAVPNYADFPDLPFNVRSWNDTYTTRCFIFAEDANHIRITGGGIIDGNGTSFGYLSVSTKSRPIGLRLHEVDSLVIDSINLRQAPQWMAVIFDCSNVYINRVTVYNQCFGSNDGIDIDCCRNVLVENSNFDTNDDPIPVKTHAFSICRDVLIRNCTMATYERAVKVGNEVIGPLVNIRFQNIVVNASSFSLPIVPLNAIYCAIADGGSMDSIYFENIQVNTPSQIPIFVRLCDRGNHYDTFPHPTVKYLKNVWFKNISATSSTTIPCSVTGIPGHTVENINFENVVITVPGNGPAVTGNVPELESTRPEGDIWGDSLPVYGLYVHHVNGLHLDSFCVIEQHADVRPLYYFEDTTNVVRLNECSNNVSGIQDISENEWKVYPNPVDDLLNINNIPTSVEEFILWTSTGSRVLALNSKNKQQFNVNVSSMPAGIYFLSLISNGYTSSQKVIIAH